MRFVSKENIKSVKELPCACCGRPGVDAHHLKSKGSGGGDYIYNLIPLCRIHHTEIHSQGLKTMANKYAGVFLFLKNNNWELMAGKWRNYSA